MKLLTLLPFLTLITAQQALHEGKIYFPPLVLLDSSYVIGIDNDQVMATEKVSEVYYFETGKILFKENGRFLSVNEEGKFSLATQPDSGFHLSELTNHLWTFILSYKGEKEFQLCADNLIGFKSNCEVTRLITLQYDQEWLSNL